MLVLLATGEAFALIACDIRKEYKSHVELFDIEERHVDKDDENNRNVRVRCDSGCSLKTMSYFFPMTVARLRLAVASRSMVHGIFTMDIFLSS